MIGLEDKPKDGKKKKTQEQYIAKVVKTKDELVNKQAWLSRLLRKTSKINYFEKRKSHPK